MILGTKKRTYQRTRILSTPLLMRIVVEYEEKQRGASADMNTLNSTFDENRCRILRKTKENILGHEYCQLHF